MREKRKCGLQNHKNNCLLVCVSLLFLMTSCRTNNELINFKDVESIKFWYISKEVCTMIPFTNCGTVLAMYPRDTVIIDKAVIQRYVSIVNKLKPINPNTYYDLRISSWIRMKKTGEEKERNIGVCIDNFFGRVLRNDTLMQGDEEEIKKFLDEILYDPLPPDAWTLEEMKGQNIE